MDIPEERLENAVCWQETRLMPKTLGFIRQSPTKKPGFTTQTCVSPENAMCW